MDPANFFQAAVANRRTARREGLLSASDVAPIKSLLIFNVAPPINEGKVEFEDMADIANRYEDNVPGKFYVDNQCIDCDLCRETAPANFTRNDDGGYSYVKKQPETPEEEALCNEAKEGCPVEAIGDNGEG